MMTLGLLSAGGTLAVIGCVMLARATVQSARPIAATDSADSFIAHDTIASFIAEQDGLIHTANRAAHRLLQQDSFTTLGAALSETFANPAGILYRLQSRADATGSAQEDVATRAGQLRLSVFAISANRFVWRLEQLGARAAPVRAGQEGVQLPMLMLGRSDVVLFTNDAARRLLGGRVKTLDRVFTDLPPVSGALAKVSCAEGTRDMLVSVVDAGAGRRALYLLPPPEAGVQGQVQGWQAFQDLPVPMIRLAPDGAVRSFNRMAATLVGAKLAEGVNIAQLMEGLGRPIGNWLSDTLSNRVVQKSEFLRLTRTDRERFVQVVLNRIMEDGEASLIAVLHDATELKSLEAQFVQSQKMQAIGQLAGGVAHDFNNLLTAISGHCDLLLLRHDQGDADYGDLVQINQNANRAAGLVRQLLAFSRKQTLRPETLDLRDTLADLTHLLNRLVGEKVTLTLSHDPVLRPIRADKRQLEQVLMNLVVNARDAMPAGGEIRIVTECITLTEPLMRDRVHVPAGDYVTVEVIDNGQGIPADKVPKVFEPFFTTKRTGEGTDLGLSTAYGIVKQTGGFIFVDSQPGTGTTFILYFPVQETKDEAPPRPDTSAGTHAPASSDGVILLVEDEAPVRAFASRALRMRGFTVLEAESAEAALKTLEDRDLNVDVFVTDVVMPGMDGPSWVREALKERPGVRVVFVSGYAEDSFGEEQKQIPNSVFLPKPFSLTELTEMVNKQMH
ncbi:ATP-binding protein [Sulfitobacter sp. THAF37]|uniref:ATP-binding protein n=1 Tax=Sulfitobacter sp. THAF37 TaxID=2587855 RepID=UPI001269537A|nr:ATP-binding protein [Sulfitobacter sp. THAF37]